MLGQTELILDMLERTAQLLNLRFQGIAPATQAIGSVPLIGSTLDQSTLGFVMT
jgi:hypothetical protein